MSDIEYITLEQFNSLKQNSRTNVSEQVKAVREMEVGSAIIVSHEGYVHSSVPGEARCGLLQMLMREGKRSSKRYSLRHLHEHTKVAIACLSEREIVDPEV